MYASALVFSPRMSLIRRQFSNQFLLWIKRLLEVEKDWSSSLQILEGYSSRVWAVAFSLNSQILVSALGNKTVRLWDANIEVSYGILEGHLNLVSVVAFSPDSQLLASTLGGKTIRLWDAKIRALHSILEGHSDWVTIVAFSLDSQLLTSTSGNKIVRLQDATTGVLYGILRVIQIRLGQQLSYQMASFLPLHQVIR